MRIQRRCRGSGLVGRRGKTGAAVCDSNQVEPGRVENTGDIRTTGYSLVAGNNCALDSRRAANATTGIGSVGSNCAVADIDCAAVRVIDGPAWRRPARDIKVEGAVGDVHGAASGGVEDCRAKNRPAAGHARVVYVYCSRRAVVDVAANVGASLFKIAVKNGYGARAQIRNVSPKVAR